jgi:prefoldin subunit 5
MVSTASSFAGTIWHKDLNEMVYRTLGLLGMICGVLGIIICLAVAGATWIGSNRFQQRIAQITSNIDLRIQHVGDELDQLHAPIGSARTIVQEFGAQANTFEQTLLTDVQAVDERLDSIRATVDDIGDRIREAYAATSERILALNDTLVSLQSVFGRVPIPQLPVEQLQAMDERVHELDARLDELNTALAQLRTSGTDRNTPIRDIVGRLGDATAQVDDRLSSVDGSISAVQTRLQEAQSSLQETQSTIDRYINFATLGAILLCAWGVFLHVILSLYSLTWLRRPISTVAQPVPQAG